MTVTNTENLKTKSGKKLHEHFCNNIRCTLKGKVGFIKGEKMHLLHRLNTSGTDVACREDGE